MGIFDSSEFVSAISKASLVLIWAVGTIICLAWVGAKINVAEVARLKTEALRALRRITASGS